MHQDELDEPEMDSAEDYQQYLFWSDYFAKDTQHFFRSPIHTARD